MTEREKMAQIIAEHLCPQGKAHKTLYGAARRCYSRNNFADCEKVSECVDALIAANIGDVTAWKGRAEKEKAEKNKWKCTANDWKQRFESREKQLGELRTTSYDVVIRKNKIISEQKTEIVRLTTERDEHKRCAEVMKRALDNTIKAFHETLSALFPDTKIDLVEWKKNNLANAEKEIAEEQK